MSNESLPQILSDAGSIGILHHWDADGIASAAQVMAIDRDKEYGNDIPTIGNFTDLLPAIDRLTDGERDLILGLDLAVTSERLKEISASLDIPLAWVDHHSNPPSPVEGVHLFHPQLRPGYPWEANAWFLASLLRANGILPAVGICGDMGFELRSHPVRRVVERMLPGDFDLDQLFAVTDLIDSNYRVDHAGEVRRAPSVLVEHLEDPVELLDVGVWRRNKDRVDTELERLAGVEIRHKGDVAIKDIESGMHITSVVARRFAIDNAGSARVVIVRHYRHDNAIFYVRRTGPEPDLVPVIGLARNRGYSAGGKPEVVGMVVPVDEVEPMTEQILRYMEA